MTNRNNKTAVPAMSPYPGQYTPLTRARKLLSRLKKHRQDAYQKPALQVAENEDCYTFKVDIPGVNRENIFIRVHKDRLSVIAMRLLSKPPGTKHQHRAFGKPAVLRHIRLPTNADTAFSCAEYRSGILSLHISKCQGTVLPAARSIAVY